MLKLEPVSAEPFWLDVLPGVRIQFRPVSVAAMLIARGAAGEAPQAGGGQAPIEAAAGLPPPPAPTPTRRRSSSCSNSGLPSTPSTASMSARH